MTDIYRNFRLDTHLLDDIRDEIEDRMNKLRFAVDEVPKLEATLAALNGEEPMNTKQRARKRARRKAHHNESMGRTVHKSSKPPTIYLNDEQVEAMKQEAKRKKVGLARMMARHGYENDGKGWTVQS